MRWLCPKHHAAHHHDHPTGVRWQGVSLRLTVEQHQALKAAAARNDRSLQREIIHRLFRWADTQVGPEPLPEREAKPDPKPGKRA